MITVGLRNARVARLADDQPLHVIGQFRHHPLGDLTLCGIEVHPRFAFGLLYGHKLDENELCVHCVEAGAIDTVVQPESIGLVWRGTGQFIPKWVAEAARDTDALRQENRIVFYASFALGLSIALRNIGADESLALIEKVDHMKGVNTIMHQVLSHLKDLQTDRTTKTEEGFWKEALYVVVHKKAIASEVAIAETYAWARLRETGVKIKRHTT